MQVNELSVSDLQLTAAAHQKMAELIGQVEGDIAGIRIYAQPGGCSGMSFGMTFTDTIETGDLIGQHDTLKIIVGADTIDHLRGAQIDFVDRGDGNPAFVFNNIPQSAGGGCGTCGSAGGGCG